MPEWARDMWLNFHQGGEGVWAWGLAFGSIPEDESGNWGFAEELDAVGARPRFLGPLHTEAGGLVAESQFSTRRSGRTAVLTLYSAKRPSWIFH